MSRMNELFDEMRKWDPVERMNMAACLAHSAIVDTGNLMMDAGYHDTVAGHDVYLIASIAGNARGLRAMVAAAISDRPATTRSTLKEGDMKTPLCAP